MRLAGWSALLQDQGITWRLFISRPRVGFPAWPFLCPRTRQTVRPVVLRASGTPQPGCSVNDTQQLYIVGGGSGPYTWGVSGGGSINPSGLYTAPASNANCSGNPTISLICNGQVMATLSIAINGWASPTVSGNSSTEWVYHSSVGRVEI